MRDDFSAPVKALLARRVAYLCSFAGCRAYTIGPSDTPDAAASVGEAAHITAAAPGGPRYDPDLSADERASYSNGIWMCRYHARLIDADETFTTELLHTWKTGAEQRARVRLLHPGAGGPPTLNLDLADFSATGQVNEAVGTVLRRSNVAAIWGRSEAGTIQDLLIEVARNAIDHGRATRVGVVIEPHRITLYDDGAAFDPVRSLVADGDTPSGGRIAVQNLLRAHGLDLLMTYRRHGEMNELDVARVEGLPRDQGRLSPCTVALGLQEARHLHVAGEVIDTSSLSGCGDVVVLLPPYMSISDAFMIAKLLSDTFGRGAQQLHLVVTNASDYVVKMFADALPAARILRAT